MMRRLFLKKARSQRGKNKKVIVKDVAKEDSNTKDIKKEETD